MDLEQLPRRIFVCSALRGDYATNIQRTQDYCRWTMSKGPAAYAPHLIYPQFFSDDDHVERDMCITAGLSFLSTCSELWAFCVGGRISSGMLTEISSAIEWGIPVVYHAVECVQGSYSNTSGLNIGVLDHLPSDEIPGAHELVTAPVAARETTQLFQQIESDLEDGAIYEDFQERLDVVLGTGEPDRDRQLELDWQNYVDTSGGSD